MSRRLADLEALILATHVRERAPQPDSASSAGYATSAPIAADQHFILSTFAHGSGRRNTPPDRLSVDESTEDDVPSPLGAEHSLIDVNKETHGVVA